MVSGIDLSSSELSFGDRLFWIPTILAFQDLEHPFSVLGGNDLFFDEIIKCGSINADDGEVIRLSNAAKYRIFLPFKKLHYINPRGLPKCLKSDDPMPIARMYFEYFNLQNYEKYKCMARDRIKNILSQKISIETQKTLSQYLDKNIICLDAWTRRALSRNASNNMIKKITSDLKEDFDSYILIGQDPLIKSTGIPHINISFWETLYVVIYNRKNFHTLDGFWAHISFLFENDPNIVFRGAYLDHDKVFHIRHMLQAF